MCDKVEVEVGAGCWVGRGNVFDCVVLRRFFGKVCWEGLGIELGVGVRRIWIERGGV